MRILSLSLYIYIPSVNSSDVPHIHSLSLSLTAMTPSKRNKGGASRKIDPVGASKKNDDQTTTPSKVQEVSWYLIISLVLLGVLAGFFAGCLFDLYVVQPAWTEMVRPAGTEMVPKWRLDFKCSVIHILGDSTVAAGNFEMTPLPYGVDFKGSKPTGRFSNGYTIGDYSGV